MLKYTIIFIIPYLIIGANVNYSFRTDMPEWKKTCSAVFFALRRRMGPVPVQLPELRPQSQCHRSVLQLHCQLSAQLLGTCHHLHTEKDVQDDKEPLARRDFLLPHHQLVHGFRDRSSHLLHRPGPVERNIQRINFLNRQAYELSAAKLCLAALKARVGRVFT